MTLKMFPFCPSINCLGRSPALWVNGTSQRPYPGCGGTVCPRHPGCGGTVCPPSEACSGEDPPSGIALDALLLNVSEDLGVQEDISIYS